MGVERQQGAWYQPSLFEVRTDDVRHGAGGEGGTGPAACEESQALHGVGPRTSLDQQT